MASHNKDRVEPPICHYPSIFLSLVLPQIPREQSLAISLPNPSISPPNLFLSFSILAKEEATQVWEDSELVRVLLESLRVGVAPGRFFFDSIYREV